MTFLLNALSGWLYAGLGLGLFVGIFTTDARAPADWRGGPVWALSALVLGAAAAALRLAPGRYGLWLETGLLLSAAFLIGAFAAAGLRILLSRGREGRSPPPKPAAPAPQKSVKPPPAQEASQEAVPQEAVPQEASQEAPVQDPAVDFVEAANSLAAAATAALAAYAQAEAALEPAQIVAAAATDDLSLIRGVDAAEAEALASAGVVRFNQIAGWNADSIDWAARLFPDAAPPPRDWVVQALLLAGGAPPELAHQAALGGAEPQIIAPDAKDALYAGVRPLALLHPPLGRRDDLIRIAGIDSALAARMNALGVWTHAQIAHWTPENRRWIGAYLAAPGRVERENWVEQAKFQVETPPRR